MSVGHKVTTVKIMADLPSPRSRSEAYDVPITGSTHMNTRGIRGNIGSNKVFYPPSLLLHLDPNLYRVHNLLNIFQKIA